MASQRENFRLFLMRGDLEGALASVEDALPGQPGASTRVNNLSGARALLSWAQLEWRSVLHPDANFAQAYLEHLRVKHGGETASIQNRLTHARNLFRALRRYGVCETNPFDHVRSPTHTPERHRVAYSASEVARLVASGDAAERAWVLCGAHAGLTGPEVLRLKWDAVDFRRSVIQLAGREVPMDAELERAMRVYGEASAPGALFPAGSAVFAFVSLPELRAALFSLCRRAGVWYGGRAWRALRAHAGVRFWQEHRDFAPVAALLGLRPGGRTLYVVQNFARLAGEAG